MTDNYSLASELFECFLVFCVRFGSEARLGNGVNSIMGTRGEGTQGFTLWVGKEMCGHWNFTATLKSRKASLGMGSDTFAHCLGKSTHCFKSLVKKYFV